jgi:hypothetical protein
VFEPKNLARTALAPNAMAWFGLAVFFLEFAGERTYSALTARGGVLTGWIPLRSGSWDGHDGHRRGRATASTHAQHRWRLAS